jgi:plastocyanin
MRTAILAWTAVLLAAAAAANAGQVQKIIQSGRAFQPAEITIDAGDTLRFDNEDDFIHQIFVDSDVTRFDSAEQPPGENVDVTFPVKGTFPVRCHIHPKMLLTVHVK